MNAQNTSKVETVVFVDTHTRALRMYAASVTSVKEEWDGAAPQVILRFAAAPLCG